MNNKNLTDILSVLDKYGIDYTKTIKIKGAGEIIFDLSINTVPDGLSAA